MDATQTDVARVTAAAPTVSGDATAASSQQVIADSYAYCRRLASASRSNFVLSFYLLPSDQRRAMYALYALMRLADDAVDDAATPRLARARLQTIRDHLAKSLRGEPPATSIWPALEHAAQTFDLSADDLTPPLDGVAMDIEGVAFQTNDDLHAYCDLVAGAVGIVCLKIWRCRITEDVRRLALTTGRAFQWTNILRDVSDDAKQGRVYLPGQLLRRHCAATSEVITSAGKSAPIAACIRSQCPRVYSLYDEARNLETHLQGGARKMFRMMFLVYRRLLVEVERRAEKDSVGKVALQRITKLSLLLRALSLSSLPCSDKRSSSDFVSSTKA